MNFKYKNQFLRLYCIDAIENQQIFVDTKFQNLPVLQSMTTEKLFKLSIFFLLLLLSQNELVSTVIDFYDEISKKIDNANR